MKIRLKVSVKTRGGKIFIPGVYDLEKQDVLAALLENVSDENVFEALYVPAPVIEKTDDSDEDGQEDDQDQEDEAEEGTEEEIEEKPKKKKKKKRVI